MTSRNNITASNRLFRLLTLFLFLILIANPNVWSFAGFKAPELSINLDFILRLFCFKENIGIHNVIKGVFIASIVFFIYNNIIYKNSPVEKIYRNLKDWESILPTILHQYLFILVQCVLWGVVFVFGLLFDLLPDGLYMKGITLGFGIAIANILPICLKLWIKATHLNKLIAIDLAKRMICGFIIGFTLVSFIWYLPYGEELTSYTIIDLLKFIFSSIEPEDLLKLLPDIVNSILEEIEVDDFLKSVADEVGLDELWKFVKDLFNIPSWP
ncbi:hypothetical protein [Methanosarcina acetivorans]|nr:hypothetical protein [Methanosarcina acetivorans]